MTTDFIHGRPMKQIVVFSLPIMLSSLLQYTYNWWIILLSVAMCLQTHWPP